MAGNESLQKRGGANAPDRSRDRNIVPSIAGRAKSVILTMDGPDIELVPPPDPKNRGRCYAALSADGEGGIFGVAGAEAGCTIQGGIFFIEANGTEHQIGNLDAHADAMAEVDLYDIPPAVLFPCLQSDEKLIFRPDSVVADQRGLFLSAYCDTNAIGIKVPLVGVQEVVVVEAPPGKFVGFPSTKGDAPVGPLTIVAGSEGVDEVEVVLYLEDTEGRRVRIGAFEVEHNDVETMDAFEGVLTLAPGEKIIAVPEADPGSGVSIYTTIAYLNAADE